LSGRGSSGSTLDIHGDPALARMVPHERAEIHMALELPLTLDAGRQGTLVASSDASGWDVRVDVDGTTILRSHVSDWHRVERLRARVETAAHAATAPGPARRAAGS
jgi:hypothetical protein